MNKINKLLLVLLLVLSILTGCNKKETEVDSILENETFSEYLNLLENYEPRPKDGLNEDNEEFDSFLNSEFTSVLEEDFITYHFQLEDPSLYSLKKPEVKLNEVNYDTTEKVEELIEDLKKLHAFDYNSLSRRQQIDFEAYEYSIYESIIQLEISKYESLFSRSIDVIENLITTLTEFKFRTDEDVLDYLIILDDVDRYLNDVLEYTNKQKENGFVISNYSIDNSVEYLDSLLSKVEDNVLIVEFEKNLSDYGNYSDEKYVLEKNKDLVINEVIPCFKEVRSYLENSRNGMTSESLALCKINRDLAKAKFIIKASDNSNIDEIFSRTEALFFEMRDEWYEGIYDADSYKEYLDASDGKFAPFGMNDIETLDYLESNIYEYYKDFGRIDYVVSLLDESSASKSILAYYLQSPIDNTNTNVIRVNKANLEGNTIQIYTTLAHEGFPGHLFQNAYSKLSNLSIFRNELSFIGYTEGYGVYAQNMALEFANLKAEYTKDIIEFETSYYFPLYSLMDIGINYYGWSKEDFKKFLAKVDLFAEESYDQITDDLFDVFIDMSGTYCSYGIGYVNFTDLKELAVESLGEKFDDKEFHDVILKDGELPFVIVRQNVLDYINKTE